MSTIIRVNGRGNAWPIQLGLEHPFYDKSYQDIANVSFSIINSKDDSINKENINWEVLIDAGHGAIQHLITNENRIPEALILTHAHHDHTFGIDWLIQSYCRQNDMKPYPVYATKRAWDFTKQSYPHLEDLVVFKELKYGIRQKLDEVNIEITPFPVYHGESAVGSCMLVVEVKKSKAIFSGDVLCPLIRNTDYSLLSNAKYFFADTNNRFPYPKSNHWSVVNTRGKNSKTNYLEDWLNNSKISHFIVPTIPIRFDEDMHNYFDTFLNEQFHKRKLFLSINEFAKDLCPENVLMVHYSGSEDVKFHGESQLNDIDLSEWANNTAKNIGLSSTFFAPKVGDIFKL